MELQLRSDRTADGIVTLWLEQPHRSVVVLDQWLLDQLHLFFDLLDREPEPAGFVLRSGNPRVFVAGADLAEIDALDDTALHAYLTEGAEAFARISSLSCPSVACLNRTALGGGLEIAMHCDGLVAAIVPGDKPWRIGLPEAGLGLCPGWGGTQMLPARMDPAEAIRMVATGGTWTADAAPSGLFDAIVSTEDALQEAAITYIKGNPDVGSKPTPRCIDANNVEAVRSGLESVKLDLPNTPSAHAVREAVEIGIAEGWAAAIAAERRLLVGLRHTPQARERLEAFFAKK
ncbi:MAG: enoyl-CoA hydratase/isomerase family protein [Phycisphaerales bacterium]|nr:enoyl-CoA hydratase/isomerase family protein [Phycisphaerales bacterium]